MTLAKIPFKKICFNFSFELLEFMTTPYTVRYIVYVRAICHVHIVRSPRVYVRVICLVHILRSECNDMSTL